MTKRKKEKSICELNKEQRIFPTFVKVISNKNHLKTLLTIQTHIIEANEALFSSYEHLKQIFCKNGGTLRTPGMFIVCVLFKNSPFFSTLCNIM